MSVDDHAGAASRAHGQLDVVEDAVCLGCGCTCDDIRLRIQDDRIVAADRACSLGVAWFGSGDVPAQALEGGLASTPQRAVEAMARVLTEARSPLVYMAPDVTCETQRQAVAI